MRAFSPSSSLFSVPSPSPSPSPSRVSTLRIKVKLRVKPTHNHNYNSQTQTVNHIRCRTAAYDQSQAQNQLESEDPHPLPSSTIRPCCSCTTLSLCLRRRHLVGIGIGIGIGSSSLLPIFLPSKSNSNSDSMAAASDSSQQMEREMEMNKYFHPPRPDWYQELYAQALDQGMKAYEAEIADYKTDLFHNLAPAPAGKTKKILELGVGTGPNFKYYVAAAHHNIHVTALDPNIKMEKYARKAAIAAGLPPTNFTFMQGVGEALPLRDNSMDAVIGTLVLCSVKDIHLTLQDRTLLLWQSLLDPLQQLVSDGCHLTRETGKHISNVGFSGVILNTIYLSTVSLINPHIYGIARK